LLTALAFSSVNPVSSVLAGETPFAPQFLPTLHTSPAGGPIRIDGELDDAGWQGAAKATGFAEVSPGDQVEPPVRSEAWVTYDDVNLYVALIAFDDPEEVRVSVCDRDNIFSDDYFGVMLDTHGNQSWGYELFVNPLGIQGDLRMDSSGDEDISFDLIWNSRGRVTDSGYQVEIAIPFASLRYPEAASHTWRINFWRDHQRDIRRRYAWAARDRDNPCFMCQWGTLTGITGINGAKHTEVIASAIGSQAGALMDSDDPLSTFDNDRPRGEAAVNLSHALSTSSTLEFALNPDFSQIESDAGQIDVNTTFALFYPERRPFFQEGSDLLATWINAVYTRSMNDPQVAGKFSGQYGKTRLLYLAARDENSPLIVPGEERSDFLLLGKSTSNIVRAQRSFWGDSQVGALVTDRRVDDGGSGTVLSVDSNLRVLQNYRLEAQVVTSRTVEPDDSGLTEELDEELRDATFAGGRHTVAFDGESYWGRALYASIERWGRVWDFDFDYWDYGPSFRSDNGFTTRNDYRQVSGWQGLYFQPNRSWLVEWGADVGIGRVWNHENRFKDEWLRPGLWFGTKGQTQIGGNYLMSKERFGPGTFPGIRILTLWGDTRFSEMLGGGFSTYFGQGIYRDFDDPELADQFNWSVYLRLKPSRQLELETDLDCARMDSRLREENLFAGYILRNRVTFNFTRQWFLRLVLQYNDFSDRLDVEPLLTYRLNPFTVFYLGSASHFQRYCADEHDVLQQNEWRNCSRQYFAKLQYLFRL
jgi:hypothetical protein